MSPHAEKRGGFFILLGARDGGWSLPEDLQTEMAIVGKGTVLRHEGQLAGNSLPDNQAVKWVFMAQAWQAMEGRGVAFGDRQNIKARLANDGRKIIGDDAGKFEFTGGVFKGNLPKRDNTDEDRHVRVADALRRLFAEASRIEEGPEQGMGVEKAAHSDSSSSSLSLKSAAREKDAWPARRPSVRFSLPS